MCIKIDIVLSYDDDINFDYSKTRKLFYFQSAPKSTRYWDYKSNCRRILYGLGKTSFTPFRPKTYTRSNLFEPSMNLMTLSKAKKIFTPFYMSVGDLWARYVTRHMFVPALCFFSWLGLMPKKCNQHWRLRANYATDKFDKVLFTRFSSNLVFPNHHSSAAAMDW